MHGERSRLTEYCSYTWANELCAGDNEERAIVISSMNGFQYAVAAWLPIVIFPQTMAPTFRYGFPGTFGLVIAALMAIVAIQVLHIRSIRGGKDRQSSINEVSDEEAGVAEGHVTDLKDPSKPSKAKDVDGSI